MGNVEDSTIVSDMLALRDYAFEPDGEIVASIFDNIAAPLVIVIDLSLLSQDSRTSPLLASTGLVEKRMRS